MKKFAELYKDGEAIFDEIHDHVEEWHTGDSILSLADYLGLSQSEYEMWVETSDAFLEIHLTESKEKKQ